LIALVLACAYPEEEFVADYDAAVCDWKTDCEDYQNEDECVGEASFSGTDCVYDSEGAKECVAGIDQMPCPSGEPDWPVHCTAVWDCEG